jgi:glycosyltransferase involved in cell wall biosynthesis
LISAIIPTRNRPDLLLRAARSALAQTYENLEVVIVIDGRDVTTSKAIESVVDKRLRVVTLDQIVGGAAARNEGVRHAKGDWIAFLDDDDEWMPEKLVKQAAQAISSRHRHPIVSSRVFARAPKCDYIWPRRLPRSNEHIAEYLFNRSSLFQGEGLIATSTILAPKALLLTVPFRDLRKHQDWDWVLRATMEPGVGVEFCDEPLSIWYVDQERPTISNTDDWRFSLSWAKEMNGRMSPRAYAGFLLTVVAAQAATETSSREYLRILKEARLRGAPNVANVALFFGMRAIPRSVRRSLRELSGKAAP